jgi:hypothetical protein
MTEVGGKLYFTALDELHGRGLWVLDLHQLNDDLNQDGLINIRDLDTLCAAVVSGNAGRDEIVGFLSRQNTGTGDANFDRRFDSSNLVSVFQRGKYESSVRALWSEGDWNCDGLFDTEDLVAAFQLGWYDEPILDAVAPAF